MIRSALPARLAHAFEHVLVILSSEPGRAAACIHLEGLAVAGNCLLQSCLGFAQAASLSQCRRKPARGQRVIRVVLNCGLRCENGCIVITEK